MRLASELQHSSRKIDVTNSENMAVTLASFTSFFQDEGKSLKRGENHYKSGHVESGRYDGGELVGRARASLRDKLYSVT